MLAPHCSTRPSAAVHAAPPAGALLGDTVSEGVAAVFARARAWQTDRAGRVLLAQEVAVSASAMRAVVSLLRVDAGEPVSDVSRADVVALRLLAGLDTPPAPDDDARSWALARCRLDDFAQCVAV